MNKTTGFLLAAALLYISVPLCAGATEPPVPPVPPDMSTVTVKGIKDRDTMPYSILYKQMLDFKNLKENDKIYLRFFFEIKKGFPTKFGDLVVSVDGGDLHLPATVEDDGTVNLPVSQAAFDANAEILTNQGGGSLKVFYGPGIKIPAENTFRYSEIMDGVKQSTSMMRKFWHFFFPSFLGASVRYADAHGQSLTIKAKGGDETLVVDASRKSIVLPYDPVLYRENPMVIVSERPQKILPYNTAPPKS